MSESTSLGKIYDISQSSKGYFKLTIAVNTPFKTRFLKFCLWDDELLKYNAELYKEGDEVRVSYYYQDNFPKFLSMVPQSIDECPDCFTFYEASDAQRIVCPESCSTHTEVKERVHNSVKLVSITVKSFRYPPGRCLVFIDDNTGETFHCTIFESHPIFMKTGDLELLKMYNIIGWRASDRFKNSLDVIDIY